MAKKPADETPDTPTESGDQFQLTPGWVIVGVLFVGLGIVCGLVMSSATLIR